MNIDFGNSYSNPIYYAKNLYLNNVEFSTDVLESNFNLMFGYTNNEVNIYVKNENIAKFINNNLGAYSEKYNIFYGSDNNWTEYLS